MRANDDPPRLRAVIGDAGRLAEELTLDELLAGLHDEWARAWLAGRAGELAQVVADARAAFRQGRVDDAGAAAALAGYLRELRRGKALHLGIDSQAPARAVVERGGDPTRNEGSNSTDEEGSDTTLGEASDTTDEETARRAVDAQLLEVTRRQDPAER